jgi:hypothetical protein
MKHFVILVACLAVLCVQHAQAATISYTTGGVDGYAEYDGINWTAPILDSVLEVYLGVSSTQESRSALEFNINPNAHIGETIVSATLRLYEVLDSGDVGVYGYVGNGSLEVLDLSQNIASSIVIFTPLFLNNINVTAFVSGLFTNGYQYVGFQLRELFDGSNEVFGSSRISGGGVPLLIIEYAPAPIPEPSTMLLLGSGLVGLIGYGRRRMKKQ